MKRQERKIYINSAVLAGILCAVLAGICIGAEPGAFGFIGAEQLRAEQGLSGDGVVISALCRSFTYKDGWPANDYMVNAGHRVFEGARIYYPDEILGTGFSAHSTAIAALLIGYEAGGNSELMEGFEYSGIVPGAELEVYEFWQFLNRNIYEGADFESDIITLSLGTVYEDWWTRGLEMLAVKKGITIIAGAGNGSRVYDPLLYPAAGANVIAVGVMDSLNLQQQGERLGRFGLPRAEISSTGPTVDNRSKPDLVAPANCLVPQFEGQGYIESGAYSSYAVPAVAGTAGLLMEKVKTGRQFADVLEAKMGHCLIKSALLSSAKKQAYWHKGRVDEQDDKEVAMDYLQGAGVVDAKGAFRIISAKRAADSETNRADAGWDMGELDGRDKTDAQYRIAVDEPFGKKMTATVVWNNNYSERYPFAAEFEKNMNLRLEIWGQDPNRADTYYLLDYCDTGSDNVEHIYSELDGDMNEYVLTVRYSDNDRMGKGGKFVVSWRVDEPDEADSDMWYDLNGDGEINPLDFTKLLKNYGNLQKGNQVMEGDINMDEKVDTSDINILMEKVNERRN